MHYEPFMDRVGGLRTGACAGRVVAVLWPCCDRAVSGSASAFEAMTDPRPCFERACWPCAVAVLWLCCDRVLWPCRPGSSLFEEAGPAVQIRGYTDTRPPSSARVTDRIQSTTQAGATPPSRYRIDPGSIPTADLADEDEAAIVQRKLANFPDWVHAESH